MTKTSNAPVLSALLFLLVAETPVLAISSSRVGMPIAAMIIATTVLLLPRAPRNDVHQSVAIWRPLAALAALPAVWMLLQIVPTPLLGWVEHPIWQSAAAALPELHSGHVSIDLGSTLRALAQYLGVVALVFATCALARDRELAEKILFALCTISVLVAFELLLFWNGASLELGAPNPGFPDNLVASTSLGTILNLAFMVRTAERYETKAGPQALARRTFVLLLILGAAGAFLCLFATWVSTTINVVIAVGFGCVAFVLVIVLRRLHVGRWTAVTICSAVVILCFGVIVLRFAGNSSMPLLVRLAQASSADAGAAMQRLLSDASWAGAGVGSYQALAATYRDAAGLPSAAPVNTISSVILGWGYLGVCLLAAVFAQLLVLLFRGAFARGRDAFFATGAAACLVTMICEAFCDASLTDATFEILAAIIVGLGLAQTVGRQVR